MVTWKSGKRLPTLAASFTRLLLRTRSQSTTGTSLERDKDAECRCVALRTHVQKEEGPSFSCAGPSGLAPILRDLDADQRAKTEIELLWYYRNFVESLNTGGKMFIDLVLREARLWQITCTVGASCDSTDMWRGYFCRGSRPPNRVVEIRGAGPCRGRAQLLCGCGRWSLISMTCGWLTSTMRRHQPSAGAMARRRPKEYRRKVDAATHCSGVRPHT